MASLTVEEVRAFISDDPKSNYLLDGEEFSPSRILLAMDLAVDSYNMMPPRTAVTAQLLPSKAVLLYGTLHHLYNGACAHLARNHMEYSDGGLTVPVEERMPLYQQLAGMYGVQFQEAAKAIKLQDNIEAGWGGLASDMMSFPHF